VNALVLVWVAALVFGFWFLVIRPQRIARERASRLDRALDVGDTVVTVGGLYGELVAFEGDDARLEIAPGTVVLVARRAIASRVDRPDDDDDEVAEAADEAAEGDDEAYEVESVEDGPAERR
jgi:preprotein translocase subunit YajC